jgi:hypothetical protein
MKFNSKLVVLAVSLLLAVSAFASDTHKGSLQTFNALQVNGKTLPAGEYQVKWEGNGPNLQLNILKNNKVVATTDAHVVELAQKPSNNSAVTNTNPDGTRSLDEIRFAGKKFAFAIGQGDRAQVKGSNASK